jgi:plasmid stabilization system protein ParE
MRYRLSELAEQDLLEIWLYVAADASVERADRLVEAIGQRFELLAEHTAWDGGGLSSALTCARSWLRTT